MSKKSILSNAKKMGVNLNIDNLLSFLADRRDLFIENSSTICIFIYGLTDGIKLDDLPEFIEQFITKEEIESISLKKISLKRIGEDPKKNIIDTKEFSKDAFKKFLKVNRKNIIEDFLKDISYLLICETGSQKSYDLEVYDSSASTAGECWLRIKNRGLVLRRNN